LYTSVPARALRALGREAPSALTARHAIRSVIAPVAVDVSKLNPPQREAVVHGGGPLLVLAGAGSGKTRVITYRIAHLLDLGIPPDAIAALTFTNKAAEEMRERISKLLGDRRTANKLTMGTFHALGLDILRHERKALGYPRGFAVYDQADQLGVVRELMRTVKDLGKDGERRFDVKAILTRISLAKNAMIAPEAYEPREADEYDLITAEIYPRYQEALRAFGAFDFDDLIVEPVHLMARDPAVQDRWQGRFRFVLVDEFQDTNKAQLGLVKELVARHTNLTVVGDDDQSIYAWRGADPTGILKFADVFPGATVVKLEQNYRSTKTILAAANAVIAHNAQRHGKVLWSQLADGEPITHAVAADVEQETKWVAQELVRLHEGGRRWEELAVLYRSNLQAKALEDELRQLQVPYSMIGGQEFFERKEVKDVIAYLRVALNPRDELSLRRILNYPARGIGAASVARLAAGAHARHQTLWDALREVVSADERPGLFDAPAVTVRTPVAAPAPAQASLARSVAADDDDDLDAWGPGSAQARANAASASYTGTETAFEDPWAAPPATPAKPASGGASGEELRPATRRGIADLVATLTRLARALREQGAVAATRALIEDIRLHEDLRDASPSQSAAQRRIDNVEGLLGSLTRFAERSPGIDALGEYLRRLSLETSDDSEAGGDKVTMTTLHGAKGLEFPVVFMVGLEEELLPHARTLNPNVTDVMAEDHASDVSEERRLCYVGITRAQRKLYLTRACTRISRGRSMARTPSRFLLEVPDELLEVIDLPTVAREKVPTDEVRSFFAKLAFDD
jgi:DNA helicase-2/ATP-dependent DNA helicase PcrA